MKRTALCFLLISCLFSFTAAWADTTRLIPLDAKLEIVSGQVKLTRVGSTKTDVITQACDLYSGDLLETLRESKATLAYTDGTIMRIKERTLVEVQPMSIRVFKGKTWYKFTKRGTEFRIETPTLVAGIRGTEFEVAVSSRKKSSVSVIEGAVAVNSAAKGKGVVLHPGMATHCESGSQLVAAYKFNVDLKKAEWAAGDWNKSTATGDVYGLFINYMNLKNELGVDDPKTLEAKEAFEKAKSKK